MSATVDILLATYNGEAFLAEQLRSIETQTFSGWHLIVRDDGSRDGTLSILSEFRARFPDRVTLVEDADQRLGPKGNFNRLLHHSANAYCAFCDQDDIWENDKLSHLLAKAREIKDPNRPWLLHSDLTVVDRDGNTIAPSFWEYQFIDPSRCSWRQQLVQSVVTGCTMLFNDSLRMAAVSIPDAAIMHDWWLGLVAASQGEILWTEKPTVRYRQHGSNDTGAKRWGGARLRQQVISGFVSKTFSERMKVYRLQAAALLEYHGATFSEKDRTLLSHFANLDEYSFLRRRYFLLKSGILKRGLVRNVGMLWAI